MSIDLIKYLKVFYAEAPSKNPVESTFQRQAELACAKVQKRSIKTIVPCADACTRV